MPSLIAINRARQASRDADEAIEASKNWYTAQSYAVKREREEHEARRRAAIAAMNDRYQTKRAARKAAEAAVAVRLAAKKAAAAAPPDSGQGWRVCPGPTPQADLQRFVQEVDDLAFHGLPWPDGWRARWGEVDRRVVATPRMVTLAACVRAAHIIIVDRRHAVRGTAEDFTLTILHELAHLRHRADEAHGPAFTRTLARVTEYFRDLAAPTPAAPVTAPPVPAGPPPTPRPRPEPVRGHRWTPRGWVAAPHLNPDLEYR